MGKQHCSVDIVACICCACSCCSAHNGSDELRCYLNIVLLFICLLGHNLLQYSQFHLRGPTAPEHGHFQKKT